MPPWAWTTAPGAVAPTGPQRAAWPSMTTRVALWGTARLTLTLTVPVPACRYFFAMLDDRDRNARYNEAIRACIDDFNRENPDLGGPRVLDVGVGTGFLSACCLLAGAKHVTGVDVNESMVQEATRNLRRIDPSEERFEVVHVGPGSEYRSKSPFDGIQFDMIVSEILGTLTLSLSLALALALALALTLTLTLTLTLALNPSPSPSPTPHQARSR